MTQKHEFPDLKWSVPNMSDIGRSVALDLRFHYISLKNDIRRIDLMKAGSLAKKDYERVRGLNADRAMKLEELRTLIGDYRKAWKLAMGAT